jgi:integrase
MSLMLPMMKAGAGGYFPARATGMRQGELLALRWSDVDLDAGTLAVRHTLQRRTRTPAEPKTDRARRTLQLGPATVACLRDHRATQPVRGRDGYVFATRTGTPLEARNVVRAFHAALRRLGLPHQRFHELRHCFATLMLEDGEELAVVSRALGHADLSTTADVYSHLTPAMLERVAARMDWILSRTG